MTKTLSKTGRVVSMLIWSMLILSALILSACDKEQGALPDEIRKEAQAPVAPKEQKAEEKPAKTAKPAETRLELPPASAEELCAPAKEVAWEKLPAPDPKFRSHSNRPLDKSFHMWCAKKRPKVKGLKVAIVKIRKRPLPEAAKRYAIGMWMGKSGGQHYALVDKQGLRVLAIGGCAECNRAMGLLGPVWDDSEKTALMRAHSYLYMVRQINTHSDRGMIGDPPRIVEIWADDQAGGREAALRPARGEKTPEGDWLVHVKSRDSRVGRIWGEWVRIDQGGKVVSHKRKLAKEVQ